MEKDQIIGKLSSYFKLSSSEAENIYKEMFDERGNTKNGPLINWNSDVKRFTDYSSVWNSVNYESENNPVQRDENQLELEYDSFTGHRSHVEKEIEQEEESKNKIREPIPEITPLQQEITALPEPLPDKNTVEQMEKTEPVLADESKHPAAADNSYYIWYKDAESNEAETETLSYEYELMYQAAKESEYQSKMKIYAASFIFFFSFVLLMLILSPVIYKKYFVTEDIQSLGETLIGSKEEQKAVPNNLNSLPIPEEKTAYPSLSQFDEERTDENSERSISLQNAPQNENKELVSQIQTAPEVTQNEPQNLRKTDNGWADDKYNVLYIRLENGKYTIQESSWDSYEKAGKRVAEIELLNIPGLKGSIEETNLGNKGKWYRVRFGEFSTTGEARQKVEEFLRL